VQIIPHVTNEIKSQIKSVAKSKPKKDIVIIELGGTVGDIESMPFLEAVRQLHREIGDNNCIFVHTTLIPVLKTVGEQKTKPTQHSVKELRAIGIQPDVIICRSSRYLEKDIKEKISLFCDVQLEAVISAPDVECIYQIPLIFEEQGLTDFLLNRFQLPTGKHDLTKWREFVDSLLNPMRETNIALVGKYTHLKDSYLSHIETLKHCGAKLKTRINIIWIEARDSNIEKALAPLKKAEGIIVPGGFGRRGIECKIAAIKYARENNIPFLGICLGFQLAVIEFCRNVLNMDTANSTEFNPNTKYPVIDLLPEQRNVKNLGGTMRLGVYPTKLKNDSISHKLYNTTEIFERHRHRYEVNPEYVDLIESAGLKFVGKSFDDKRMEIAELENHNFFIAVQFHPEFKSRPDKPSPLYLGLVSATSNRPL
jgi:CTP synthase